MKFTIPTDPVPWARPRFVRRGGKMIGYTVPKVQAYEQTVKLLAIAAGIRPLSGPVSMSIDFHFAVPKSLERKRKPVEGGWHVKKPDADNLAKAILDALNGVAYDDDAQVASMRLRKFRLPQGEIGHVDVEVSEL